MNKELAWVLGYLLSDGSIVKPAYRSKGDETHLNFICKYSDKNVLMKIKSILRTRAKVHEYPDHKSPQAKIDIYDRKDLIEKYYNIKTEIPLDITGYERHFIRGLIDGDGTLSYRTSRKQFRIGYINEHQHITQWVSNTICKKLLLPSKLARWVKQNNVWELLWEGNVARLIAYWLYHGDITSCCLDRKREIYYNTVLNNKTFDSTVTELLYSSKGYIDDSNNIGFILPYQKTLEWCKRLRELLPFNTTPVFNNKGKKKYYHLYLPEKSFIANMRDALIYTP